MLDFGLFQFPTFAGNHSVRWEGVWRDLAALSGNTSFAVRSQAGHTIKSSLKVSKYSNTYNVHYPYIPSFYSILLHPNS